MLKEYRRCDCRGNYKETSVIINKTIEQWMILIKKILATKDNAGLNFHFILRKDGQVYRKKVCKGIRGGTEDVKELLNEWMATIFNVIGNDSQCILDCHLTLKKEITNYNKDEEEHIEKRKKECM